MQLHTMRMIQKGMFINQEMVNVYYENPAEARETSALSCAKR